MMSGVTEYRSKLKINDPLIVFFTFTEMEIYPVIFSLGLGIFFDMGFYFFLASTLAVYLVNKAQSRLPPGAFYPVVWYHGYMPTEQTITTPDPYIRLFYR